VHPLFLDEPFHEDIAIEVLTDPLTLISGLQFGQFYRVWKYSALLTVNQRIAKFMHYFLG
jgi:hypothetical protein